MAVVDCRTQELGNEVPVSAMQLDTVKTSRPRAARPRGKRLHGRMDFVHRHPLAFESMQRVGLVRRAEPLRIFDAWDVALPPAVAELQDVPAVVFVDALPELAPEGDPLVAVDRGVVRHDAPADRHRNEG